MKIIVRVKESLPSFNITVSYFLNFIQVTIFYMDYRCTQTITVFQQ